MRADKNNVQYITADGANVEAILSHSPECRGSLRFNSVRKTLDVAGGPFLEEANKAGKDGLPTVVNNYLRRAWDITIPDSVVSAQIFVAAMKNSYNPVLEYLDSPTWEGTPRIDGFLETYLDAKTRADGEDIASYVRTVSAMFLIGCVARAKSPGCKMDNVLVLEGKQYIGKSAAIRILGGEWFTDSPIDIGDKDSKILMAQNWIVELPELAALRTSDSRLQKALFSTAEDQFRMPYGRTTQKFPRQCVFVGTTNDTEYLSDPTGNRRYWVITCGEDIDLEGLERDRDQLWAEAVARYEAGEKWWMTREETAMAEAQAESRVHVQAVDDAISNWWYRMAPERRPENFRMFVVLEGIGMGNTLGSNRSLETRAGIVLRKMGMEKVRKMDRGHSEYLFQPTPELKAAPKREGRIRRLSLVQSAIEPTQPAPPEVV